MITAFQSETAGHLGSRLRAILLKGWLVATVFLQGCLLTKENASDLHSNAGNGQAYDRLVYVVLLPSGVCPDGSPIQSQVDMTSGTATLVRDNCQALPPDQQIQVTYTVDPATNQIIVVNGQQYYQIYWQGLWSLSQDTHHDMYLLGLGYPDRRVQNLPPSFKTINKFDPAGNLLWSKSLSSDLFPETVRAFPDGRMVVSVQDFNTEMQSPNTSPTAIVMLDAEGNTLWSKSYIDTNLMPPAYSAAIDMEIDTATGAIYTLGTYTPAGGQKLRFLSKLSQSGNIEWQRTFPAGHAAGKIKLTPQGDLLLTGSGSSGGTLVRLNAAGDLMNSLLFSQSDSRFSRWYPSIDSVSTTSTGNLVITGTDDTDYYGNSSQYVALLSANGTVLWSKKVLTFSDKVNPVYAAVAPDDSIYLTEYGATYFSAGKVGKIIHLSPSGDPLGEVFFQGPTSPSSIQSDMVFGLGKTLWTVASTSHVSETSPNYTRQSKSLMRVDISADTPTCTMCTPTPLPTVLNVPLTVRMGPDLSPIDVPFDGPPVVPRLAPSPIPIPVYK